MMVVGEMGFKNMLLFLCLVIDVLSKSMYGLMIKSYRFLKCYHVYIWEVFMAISENIYIFKTVIIVWRWSLLVSLEQN